ncbi:putative acyl-CoA oxidase [Helianthus anomalus]
MLNMQLFSHSLKFAALMAPLTSGRVTIVASSMNTTKVLSIRRVFSMKPNEPEVLLLDYPSHKRRLLPLVEL